MTHAAAVRKLIQRFQTVADMAHQLAVVVLDNTMSEDHPDYDRSRTWCDRQDDYAYAQKCLRQLRPTLNALNRHLNQEKSSCASTPSNAPQPPPPPTSPSTASPPTPPRPK